MQTTTLSQSSERLEYIDLAKGIGIILVVIGHRPESDVTPKEHV